MQLRFESVPVGGWPSTTPNAFSLVADNWDDYTFKTTFHLHYSDEKGEVREIGVVKIAKTGMGDERAKTDLPSKYFSHLPDGYFSLGQDREYYENLRKITPESSQVLRALSDIALDEAVFEQVLSENVTQRSLMRDLDYTIVTSQFRRLANGQPLREDYNFSFSLPQWESAIPRPDRVVFEVEAESLTPTNLWVVIGANGVGKSTLMRNLSGSLRADASPGKTGYFAHRTNPGAPPRRIPFDSLVTLSFSAFDRFPENLYDPIGEDGGVPHHVVGLREELAGQSAQLDLVRQFATMLRPCLRGPRRVRWLSALKALTLSDPLLQNEKLDALADHPIADDEVVGSREAFDRLSSGHKIALLAMTALVRYVEERTLVLFDEPETHLHPPLLSALIRLTTELVSDRNGVAIVATHSPVVLQEVPRSCALILRRIGSLPTLDHPRIETLGESISVLTSEVFGLNVADTAFHEVLVRAVAEEGVRAPGTVSNAMFSKLGSEARAIYRALSDRDGAEDG